MKWIRNHKTLTVAIILLVFINLDGFLGWGLGVFDFLLTIVGMIILLYLGLTVLLKLFFLLIYGSSKKGKVLTDILGISVILVLIYFYPFGILQNVQNSNDDIVLKAYAEGAANCNTTISYYADSTVIRKSVCFGSNVEHGTFAVKGDTLLSFFDHDTLVTVIVYAPFVIHPGDLLIDGQMKGRFHVYSSEFDSISRPYILMTLDSAYIYPMSKENSTNE